MKPGELFKALLLVVLFAQIAFSAEPVRDLKVFEAEIGTWKRVMELDQDDPDLGKKGTQVETVMSKTWGPGRKFIVRRYTSHANGKQRDGVWFMTGIDPHANQAVTHGFWPDGSYSTVRWFHDSTNKKKRMAQGQKTGANGFESIQFSLERKDEDTQIVRVGVSVFNGEILDSEKISHVWRRVEKK